MQRLFDILFAGMAILLFSPILIPVALMLRLTGEREVLYKQKRVGFKENEFLLYKFATMLKDSPNIGAGTVTIRNDPRVLPFGKFLRRTKINELPQLLNILMGDMSVIGFRPLVRKGFEAYPEIIRPVITSIKPGLSGIGSIVFRNEEDFLGNMPDPTKFYYEILGPYKGELEVWHVKNRNLILYFLLIALTVISVFSPSSNLHWKLFSDLPKPPPELKEFLMP